MTRGCDSQTLDSISSTWGKQRHNLCHDASQAKKKTLLAVTVLDGRVCKVKLNNKLASLPLKIESESLGDMLTTLKLFLRKTTIEGNTRFTIVEV